MCTALADTLFLQQESIYTEAATISGGKKKRNLAGQSHRTNLSIQLIEQKTLLLAQIKSASLPEQEAALTQLFIKP